MHMPKILISGYHGFGNCGDEAILQTMCETISKLKDDIQITALSYAPEDTRKLYQIHAVYRFAWKEVLKSIQETDILISGGGSLLQDKTSTRSLFYYLSIILTGKLLGKKVLIYSNGIGPIRRSFSRWLTKKIVNQVDLITLREELSKEELNELGVKKPPIFVTADPVFLYEGQELNDAEDLLQLEGIPMDKPLVGVMFRDWMTKESFAHKIAVICDWIVEKYDMNIVFMPMQFPNDLKISKEIQRHMRMPSYMVTKKYNAKAIMRGIHNLHLVLGMRLHALIIAAIYHIPMLGFAYDPKVDHYLDRLKMPSAGYIEDIIPQNVEKQVEEIFIQYNDYVENLEKVSKELKQKAMENNTYLMGLIQEG